MSSSDSITSFATLSAQLDSAFADRRAIFAAAGLDEVAWQPSWTDEALAWGQTLPASSLAASVKRTQTRVSRGSLHLPPPVLAS